MFSFKTEQKNVPTLLGTEKDKHLACNPAKSGKTRSKKNRKSLKHDECFSFLLRLRRMDKNEKESLKFLGDNENFSCNFVRIETSTKQFSSPLTSHDLSQKLNHRN